MSIPGELSTVRRNRRRFSIIFLLTAALTFGGTPSHAVWQFDSENSSSGLSAYASTFWADGFGPVSWERLLNLPLDDGDLWGTLTVSCIRKKPSVAITVQQAGSGNEELRFDDPGYLSITLNGLPAKRYRTIGSEYKDSFYINNTDSKTLVKNLMKRNFLSVAPRIKFSSKKVSMLFDVSGLSKGKTRFKYAGCSI